MPDTFSNKRADVHPSIDRENATKVAALPTSLQPFIHFSQTLRQNEFPISPDQTQAFITAVGMLGPKSMSDIYFAALATLAPQMDRRDVFDAIYRSIFLGHTLAEPANTPVDEDELQALDERDGQMDSPEADDINEVGEQVSSNEVLSIRTFTSLQESEVLRQFRTQAKSRLPMRWTYRRKSSSRGEYWDARQSLRNAVKHDGELIEIAHMKRKTRQRRIVLAIDISGSMKAHTDTYLRFAHTLAQVSQNLEVFTLGTRLTRVSKAMRIRNAEQAMNIAGTLVADWDGGTRLGDALHAFLSVPRFSGFARGAIVVVLSDGLERGDHTTLLESVVKLARLAWRLEWLTPLAADPLYSPKTKAMSSILPHLNNLGNGSSTSSLCAHFLGLSRSTR